MEIACLHLAKHIEHLRRQISLFETAMVGLDTGSFDTKTFIAEARGIFEISEEEFKEL